MLQLVDKDNASTTRDNSDAILSSELGNISNFNEEFNFLEEQNNIPQMEIEDNQIDFNFVNKINSNDDFVLESYLNKIPPQNSNNIIHVDERNNPDRYFNYLFKCYKINFNKFLQRYEKELFLNIELPQGLKNYQLYPNYSSFTENSKKSDNYFFLSFTLREIICYSKGGNIQDRLKEKISKLIDKILIFIESIGDEEKYEEIEKFFKMKLEKAYELYEESEEFKKFTLNKKVIFFNEKFKVMKGFSLLEKNAFVNVIKN